MDEEKKIYSVIIDSLFDHSYETVFIENRTRSINRYIQKNLFSEILFDQEVMEYYKSFYHKKNCEFNEDLVEEFITNNRQDFPVVNQFSPKRKHSYVSYTAIYIYINGKNGMNEIIAAANNKLKFGIIGFSRVGFNSERSEALLEVNIYRIRKGELFFITMNKVGDTWKIKSPCHMYGPYMIKEYN